MACGAGGKLARRRWGGIVVSATWPRKDGPAPAVLGPISAASLIRLQRKVKQPEGLVAEPPQGDCGALSRV